MQQTDPRIRGYVIDGSKMYINLTNPVQPGESVEMRFCWNFTIPSADSQMRMGHDGNVFFLAYWYPQLAVYDDVTGFPGVADGWDQDHHLGTAEYYMGYADYSVLINAPVGFLVAATGQPQNLQEVLSPAVLSRIDEAMKGSTVLSVVNDETRASAFVPVEAGVATWHFVAENVRDFAFGMSPSWNWDATSAAVGDVDGNGSPDRTLIHALYRSGRSGWNRAAELMKFTIEDMSRRISPYPWPHMTAVEGFITGGMEYPMMMLAGGNRDDASMLSVSYHIGSHMWFPMIVGQNEKMYTWMDEGLATYNQTEGIGTFWKAPEVWMPELQPYYRLANTGYEVESMRHGDLFPIGTNARGLGSYNKPSVMLHALKGILGDELFSRAYRAYAQRWAYKHPTAFDFFNTFEDVVGKDLDWFWRPAFFETWTLDQSIGRVDSIDSGIAVTIVDLGLTPMPTPVTVTYGDGRVETKSVPVETWLSGAREAVVMFSAGLPTRVAIDDGAFLPDVDRTNNVWVAAAQSKPPPPGP